MKFTYKDLYYDNYSLSADGGDDPHYKGYLDRVKVDKTEGYEVVYFCNDFLKDHNKLATKTNFQRVERLIQSNELKNIVYRSTLNFEVNRKWNIILL